MTWQPIETAPMNAVVLLCAAQSAPQHVTLGWWDIQAHHRKPRPYWRTELGYLFGTTFDRAAQWTHWMPLPEPPSSPSPTPLVCTECQR